jgi:hypothetical protein
VFTARYALSPYIKQIRFVFKGLITVSNQETWDTQDTWHVRGRREINAAFWWETPKRGHLEDLDVDGRTIIKSTLQMWTGFIWPGIGTSDGIAWTRQWTCGFHKMSEISWPPRGLLISQGSCSICSLFGDFSSSFLLGAVMNSTISCPSSSLGWSHR